MKIKNLNRSEVLTEITGLGFDDPLFSPIVGGIFLQQNPSEITDLVLFLASHFAGNPIAYLEVGSAAGGTCFVFNKYLNIQKNVIIDINQHPKHHHRKTVLKDVPRVEHVGNSLYADSVYFARENGPYDLMFIDAGHSYEEVKHDIANYSPLLRSGGTLIFHDMVACPEVKRAVDELITGRWNLTFESNVQFGLHAYSRKT